ncbi:MAG: bifunctional nuclease family protein [Thermotogae bacterium]|nr:bifunctional nuclease family protein [Thermotogota bacterium]RKX45655.1 MAG: bifunctional nuclease family protein [Thermotogota bacterium]
MKRVIVDALVLDRVHNTPVILLRVENTNRVIPIWIGSCEALALSMALDGVDFPRPMTHDLLLNIVEALDAKLERVVIHSIKDNTYYASLILKDLAYGEEEEGSFIEIDARPSDSIVLAVKKDVPIFVSNEIVMENSIEYEQKDEEKEQFKNFIEQLDIDQLRKLFKGENEDT